MNPQAPPPAAQLFRLLFGHMVTQCLAVVARLGVADQLASGPVESDMLAPRVGADPDALYRMMRALASVGIFDEMRPRTFAQTPLSDLLREDATPSFRYVAMMNGGELFRAWGDAFESAKTGKPAFEHVFGASHFAYLADHPEAQNVFNKAMSGAARGFVEVLAGVDWAGTRNVVDVGGGDGTLLLGLLARCPSLEGVVFDLPQVVAAAEAKIARSDVAARLTCRGGSFLENDLPAADAYILARVLHNWSDKKAASILGSCRRSIRAGGGLLILEEILPEGNAPHPGKLLDLQMLVVVGGRERTQREWDVLLGGAGFALRPDSRSGLLRATPI